MTGGDRSVAMGTLASLFRVSCIASILLLGGCTGFKQAIGLEEAPPDEFTVESRAPLTIPPEFNLRPPEPGAPRPQEMSASTKAREEIDAAGPGQPGNQANASGLPQLPGSGGPVASQEVGADSLSEKLLTSNDVGAGATVEKRQTSVLKGVY